MRCSMGLGVLEVAERKPRIEDRAWLATLLPAVFAGRWHCCSLLNGLVLAGCAEDGRRVRLRSWLTGWLTGLGRNTSWHECYQPTRDPATSLAPSAHALVMSSYR